MSIPFTREQFSDVFVVYNSAIWPVQIIAYVLGLVAVAAIWLDRPLANRIVLSILALMWAFNGIGYQFLFFASINPLAKVFAEFFVLQALLLAVCALAGNNKLPEPASFRAGRDLRAIAGFAFVIYSALVYPLLEIWAGHGLMAGPMFGVAPCPTTIFTIGMLLLARGRWVVWLSVIPVLWSLVGLAAALKLGIPEDIGLPVAGIVLASVLGIDMFWDRPGNGTAHGSPGSENPDESFGDRPVQKLGDRATEFTTDRMFRRALLASALAGLTLGILAWLAGHGTWSAWLWSAGTIPVIFGLAVSMTRDLLAGRLGVDAVAFVSMSAALILGQPLAGAVVAVMYAGGNLLEDFAVARAERDLKSLVDRAPRVAHRRIDALIDDILINQVALGDTILVRAGEVIPVDGVILAANATLDEAALTGEPIPVTRNRGDPVHSGTINAGETFELRASATAGESTYAGIVRMVTAAQTSKAPFIRIADRYALVLLPVTLFLAAAAWFWSGDPIRGLAVLVASTPCPLILAAPVAFIAGVSRAARLGILIKGGGPLEALARTHTVMFDKTGTLTVGGARLVAIETAPGESADELLRLTASLEQASHHVVAAAIVSAAVTRGLVLANPDEVKETMGSGLEGLVDGKRVKAGSRQLVCTAGHLEGWAVRALRRASWRSALSVFVSVDRQVIGAILLADELRQETPRAIQGLRLAGVKRIVMVTGDQAESAETIGAALDLDAVLADREPADKVEAVVFEQRVHPTLMVGDGINDAPALAAADVGIAMGARGANASSEAADVVILVDRLDRVADAVAIARRARGIAVQSITAGMILSGLAMLAAAFGWLTPVTGALTQEAIDVAVILNALRALTPPWDLNREKLQPNVARALRQSHHDLGATLNRLREIADALDDAAPERAITLIGEANRLVSKDIVVHEREDESTVYPRISKFLQGGNVLAAMSRAHREILHLARLLDRLSDGLKAEEADHYLIRDAQRVIEAIESLVRIHNAQEEDIYEQASEGR